MATRTIKSMVVESGVEGWLRDESLAEMCSSDYGFICSDVKVNDTNKKCYPGSLLLNLGQAGHKDP